VTARQNRLFIALNLPRSVPPLIMRAKSYVDAMTGNAFFPKPKPALKVIIAVTKRLAAAETKAYTGAAGAVAKRNEARKALTWRLRALQDYVQGIADANPAQAEAIIKSARMDVRRADSRNKPPFAVKRGRVAGSVRLVARAASGRAAYVWAWSADDGETWTEVGPTTRADTVITGLPLAMRCLFRYRVSTGKIKRDWSDPIAYIVD
jgi:hypothetical protein